MTRNDSSTLPRLNRTFLAHYGIVPLGVSDGTLTVAMRDCQDRDAIAAMRFATGLDIAAVSLAQSDGTSGCAVWGGASLLDQIVARLSPNRPPDRTLAPLRLLLEAGYDLEEAGNLLLSMPHLDPGPRVVAISLSRGQPLGSALRAAGVSPWLPDMIDDLAARGADPAMSFVSILHPGALSRARHWALRLGSRCAILAVPAIVAAPWLPQEAAAAIGAGAVLLGVGLRQFLASRHNSDFVRAEVTGLIARLAELPLAPEVAVRAGFARLMAATGQIYPQEPTRAGLSLAMALPALPGALLMQGDLPQAAARTAEFCLDAAERRAGWISWLLSSAVLSALGAAAIAVIL